MATSGREWHPTAPQVPPLFAIPLPCMFLGYQNTVPLPFPAVLLPTEEDVWESFFSLLLWGLTLDLRKWCWSWLWEGWREAGAADKLGFGGGLLAVLLLMIFSSFFVLLLPGAASPPPPAPSSSRESSSPPALLPSFFTPSSPLLSPSFTVILRGRRGEKRGGNTVRPRSPPGRQRNPWAERGEV